MVKENWLKRQLRDWALRRLSEAADKTSCWLCTNQWTKISVVKLPVSWKIRELPIRISFLCCWHSLLCGIIHGWGIWLLLCQDTVLFITMWYISASVFLLKILPFITTWRSFYHLSVSSSVNGLTFVNTMTWNGHNQVDLLLLKILWSVLLMRINVSIIVLLQPTVEFFINFSVALQSTRAVYMWKC